MLRTLEPQKEAENKNAEADFKNPCSYKMKSVQLYLGWRVFRILNTRKEKEKPNMRWQK